MIFLDSRYADGRIFKAWNARKRQYDLTVFREQTTYVQSFFIYEFKETDRLDNLAARYMGDPSMWWEILDINPEILDPTSIPAGTQLRIPNA
jgi:prophage DNA circulation protein